MCTQNRQLTRAEQPENLHINRRFDRVHSDMDHLNDQNKKKIGIKLYIMCMQK